MYIEMKIEDFIIQLASTSTTPGGGTVAAISGAMGAGMMEMVCRSTIENKGSEGHEAEIQQALQATEGLRLQLTGLIDAESKAFSEIEKAYQLTKTNAEEKESRGEAIHEAYLHAIQVPWEVAEKCIRTLELAVKIMGKVNLNTISDFGVAVEITYAGLESAVMNVKLQLSFIRDRGYIKEKKKQLDLMLSTGRQMKEKVYRKVAEELH